MFAVYAYLPRWPGKLRVHTLRALHFLRDTPPHSAAATCLATPFTQRTRILLPLNDHARHAHTHCCTYLYYTTLHAAGSDVVPTRVCTARTRHCVRLHVAVVNLPRRLARSHTSGFSSACLRVARRPALPFRDNIHARPHTAYTTHRCSRFRFFFQLTHTFYLTTTQTPAGATFALLGAFWTDSDLSPRCRCVHFAAHCRGS